MPPEITNEFRLTLWKTPKDKPFAVVLTGELNGKAVKIDIFKRSVHVYVDSIPQKRIRSKNTQFVEDCCNGNVNTEAIHAFLKMGQKAGMF